MKPSGKKNCHGRGLLSVNGRPFTERFMKTAPQTQNSVQINTDAIDVFPDLEQEYSILKELSAGGNSTVSLAEDRFLKRKVALKSLRSDYLSDPVRRRSFLREAQLMAQLEHPSIVPVYGIARDSSGGLHIIMKQICGKSLREYLKNLQDDYAKKKPSGAEEQKSLHDRLDLFIRICDAVAFAHSKRVLHGDLKPGNIMIEQTHNVYVMDWGNAEIISESQVESDLKDTISGTPGYLSPEAVRGENTDFRSEVFTLGLILFEMVTLSKAVTGKSAREILLKIRDGKLNTVRHKSGFPIAQELRGIIRKALHPQREKRYSSVAFFAEALRNYLSRFSCKATVPEDRSVF